MLKRVRQISEHHCGPAVIQMLLGNLGIEVSQADITQAAGAQSTITTHGTRVDQLALAVHALAPQAKLWYKDHADISDIISLLDNYHYPVGVEWQGLFSDNLQEEEEDGDYGHYSVISRVDQDHQAVIIVDPYKDYVNQDRILTVAIFEKRWWDFNEVKDPVTGKKSYQKDDRLFFIVTLADQVFPQELGLSSFNF